ncbi:hypothetical protein JCM5296_003576, partial [Sporobolomyces johnsonii]
MTTPFEPDYLSPILDKDDPIPSSLSTTQTVLNGICEAYDDRGILVEQVRLGLEASLDEQTALGSISAGASAWWKAQIARLPLDTPLDIDSLVAAGVHQVAASALGSGEPLRWLKEYGGHYWTVSGDGAYRKAFPRRDSTFARDQDAHAAALHALGLPGTSSRRSDVDQADSDGEAGYAGAQEPADDEETPQDDVGRAAEATQVSPAHDAGELVRSVEGYGDVDLVAYEDL